MVKFIDVRPFDSKVDLINLIDNIYIVEAYNNPLSFLKKGAIIWQQLSSEYKVYELTESWDSSSESNSDFLKRLLGFINQ